MADTLINKKENQTSPADVFFFGLFHIVFLAVIPFVYAFAIVYPEEWLTNFGFLESAMNVQAWIIAAISLCTLSLSANLCGLFNHHDQKIINAVGLLIEVTNVGMLTLFSYMGIVIFVHWNLTTCVAIYAITISIILQTAMTIENVNYGFIQIENGKFEF